LLYEEGELFHSGRLAFCAMALQHRQHDRWLEGSRRARQSLMIGVPEGSRTPDPRFRKRDFRVLIDFTAVQERARGFTNMHESGGEAGVERRRTGLNWPEQECSGEAVTGV
jgi:hypothetical protein